jgi:ABC-type nitrate/sulfonate/bicarbonate transport system substrate-binding protein
MLHDHRRASFSGITHGEFFMTLLPLCRSARHLLLGGVVAAVGMLCACPKEKSKQGEESVALVKVGTLSSSSDAPFFIADAKGYFAEQAIKVEFVPFKSSTEMIAPLGQGQIDVGGGGLAAAIFNAVARGVDLRIVADKGANRLWLPAHGSR